MSYHRYDVPRQPRSPLDTPTTIFGVIGLVSVTVLILMLLWCAG